MKRTGQDSIRIGGRRVYYRMVVSRAAQRLRIRVGPNGMELIKPAARPAGDVVNFLRTNEAWIVDQLRRANTLRHLRRMEPRGSAEILLRGQPTQIRVETTRTRGRGNQVLHLNGQLVIQRGPRSRTSAARSLENWLRRQARHDIQKCLAAATTCLKREPHRIYVMGQRTKWGGCSRKRNLSFNWRLIMAPPEVLNYIVTHEVVHLVEPYHSPKFWLLLRSHCPRLDFARIWLKTNQAKLFQAFAFGA